MKGQVGATIVVESERAASSQREGVIEEVLQESPPRYRVRWQDGRESIFSPAAGVARVEKPKRKRRSS
jgi:Domain of unknown function (DUF1918)